MDSLSQKLEPSRKPPAMSQAGQERLSQPKPAASPKTFDPLRRLSQPEGVVKPLQHPAPIRAPLPQALNDQPISPPRPVNLPNSPPKRRGPALGRGPPPAHTFLPSHFSRQHPLSSRHESGLASTSGSGSLVPQSLVPGVTAIGTSQETR